MVLSRIRNSAIVNNCYLSRFPLDFKVLYRLTHRKSTSTFLIELAKRLNSDLLATASIGWLTETAEPPISRCSMKRGAAHAVELGFVSKVDGQERQRGTYRLNLAEFSREYLAYESLIAGEKNPSITYRESGIKSGSSSGIKSGLNPVSRNEVSGAAISPQSNEQSQPVTENLVSNLASNPVAPSPVDTRASINTDRTDSKERSLIVGRSFCVPKRPETDDSPKFSEREYAQAEHLVRYLASKWKQAEPQAYEAVKVDRVVLAGILAAGSLEDIETACCAGLAYMRGGDLIENVGTYIRATLWQKLRGIPWKLLTQEDKRTIGDGYRPSAGEKPGTTPRKPPTIAPAPQESRQSAFNAVVAAPQITKSAEPAQLTRYEQEMRAAYAAGKIDAQGRPVRRSA